MKTSLSCATLVAVVLVASQARAQAKMDDIDNLRKELAALRAEVTALKEELARRARKEEEERAAKLKAVKEELARLTREENELKAAKHQTAHSVQRSLNNSHGVCTSNFVSFNNE